MREHLSQWLGDHEDEYALVSGDDALLGFFTTTQQTYCYGLKKRGSPHMLIEKVQATPHVHANPVVSVITPNAF